MTRPRARGAPAVAERTGTDGEVGALGVAAFRDDRGTGMIGSIIGLSLFFGFVLLAMQVAVALYATTVVTSAAFDAARIYSSSSTTGADWSVAEAHASDQLGAWGSEVDFSVEEVGGDGGRERVAVRATGHAPALLPRWIGELTGTRSIDRTIEVRAAEFR